MKTTSVKDVGAVMNLGAYAANASAKTGDNGFKTIFNGQADGNRTTPQKGQTQQTQTSGKSKDSVDAAREDALRTGEQSGKSLREKTVDSAPGVEPTEEELGEAMEVLAASVQELIQQIADTFGIPVESVQELMGEMNMEPVDLLQPENLSALLLEAAGAQDTFSLLTDEQLCADYRMLMEQGRAALEAGSEKLELTPEQLLETIADAKQQPVEETGEPLVEITVQADGDDARAELLGDAQPEEAVQTLPEARAEQEGRDAGNAKQEKGHASHEEMGNPILQTIRENNFQPQAENIQTAHEAADVDAQDVMRQIMEYMKIQVKPDVSSLEMQLHPANLGTLQIQVAAKGGVLTANFIAQNEAVKAALESQMVQLRESFEEQGVKVEAIEVTVQTHQFEQNLEQGRGRQPQETEEGRRPRARRLRLNSVENAQSAEELEPEDRLAVEMMTANGGTVDFTA